MLEVMAFIQVCDEEGCVFMTSNKEYHKAAEELIYLNLIKESTSEHCIETSKDRCFKLI